MLRFAAAAAGVALAAALQLAGAVSDSGAALSTLLPGVPPLKLHMLAADEGGNACLDGTPFGFYVATNASSRDWVIDIAGGGWCDSPESCVTRIASSNRLASSSTWAAVSAGGGNSTRISLGFPSKLWKICAIYLRLARKLSNIWFHRHHQRQRLRQPRVCQLQPRLLPLLRRYFSGEHTYTVSHFVTTN